MAVLAPDRSGTGKFNGFAIGARMREAVRASFASRSRLRPRRKQGVGLLARPSISRTVQLAPRAR
jgi:hypothetical protein